MACNKDGSDGKKVVCELGAQARIENHEFCASFFKDELQQLDGKATQSVTVGNHNLLDASSENAFQKGIKRGALPVDARPNVVYFVGRRSCSFGYCTDNVAVATAERAPRIGDAVPYIVNEESATGPPCRGSA